MARGLLKNMGDWKLKDKDKDIRGRMLMTANGEPVGLIRDLVVDTDTERVESIVLDNGREFPARDLELRGSDVLLRTGVVGERTATTGMPPVAERHEHHEEEIRVPVIEEKIDVGKRPVAEGGVRVTGHVREEPVDETVKLRETDVHVERVEADRPATEADFEQAGKTIEALETGEEAVVKKTARVVGEVVLSKEEKEREEKIHDTIRKTDVEVEEVEPKERTRKAS